MTVGAAERTISEEARDLIASARELVLELHEEGMAAVPAASAAETAAGGLESAPSSQAAVAAVPAASAAETAAGGVGPARRGEAHAESAADPVLLAGQAEWGLDPSLEDVRAVIGDCTRCRLHEGRTHIVFGDGNPDADLMFVGEGPGENEDRRGLPFVGRAGELLTQMIEKGLGLQRSDVYICNVVKCRPPGNRTPLADEVATCSRFLDGQIAAVQPRVIVTLGKPAASLLLGRDVAITKVRGTWHDYHGIPLMPTFHPAYLLRQYTVENRRRVWDDLKAALARAQESSGTAQ